MTTIHVQMMAAKILVVAAAGLTVSLSVPPLPPVTQLAELRPAFIASTARVFDLSLTALAADVRPEAIRSSATIFAPSARAGAVSVAPPFIASAGQAFAPALAAGAVEVRPESIALASAVFEPTVVPGGVSIAPAFIDSTAFMPSPRVERIDPGAVVIQPSFISSTATVFAPSVTPGTVTVSPAQIDPTSFVLAPEVRPGTAIVSPAFIPSGAFVPSPVVQPGATSVAPAFIGPTAFVAAPSVRPGAVTIAPAFIAPTAVVPAPTVSASAASAPYSDDFNRADQNLEADPRYAVQSGSAGGSVGIVGGQLKTLSNAGANGHVNIVAEQPADFAIEWQIIATGSGMDSLIKVRQSAANNFLGLRVRNGTLQAISSIGATLTVINSTSTASGSTVKLEAIGSVARFFVNGARSGNEFSLPAELLDGRIAGYQNRDNTDPAIAEYVRITPISSFSG